MQQVKDLALPLQGPGSLLWHEFDPHAAGAAKKKKKKGDTVAQEPLTTEFSCFQYNQDSGST